MLMRFFRRNPDGGTIRAVYGAIVAQSRHASFYRKYGVPDTVDGRLDMILLHLFLFLRHARREAAGRDLGQAVFDLFCQDMDDSMREMGVGDLAVPKRMRSIGEAFYGRSATYERALAQGSEAVAAALGRNVFGAAGGPLPSGAWRLAAYTQEAERRFAARGALPVTALDFPDPDTISSAEFNLVIP